MPRAIGAAGELDFGRLPPGRRGWRACPPVDGRAVRRHCADIEAAGASIASMADSPRLRGDRRRCDFANRVALTALQLSSSTRAHRWNGGRMYEAPDRYKRLISARLPGGESAGLAARGSRIRKFAAARRPADFARPARAILRGRQHRCRADDGREPVGRGRRRRWLLPWALAVGGVNFAAMRLARPPVDHLRRPLGPAGADVDDGRRSRASRGASGSAFRSICFPTLDPGTQVIAASIMAGLGIGALGLVVIPPCATAWMVCLHPRRWRIAAARPPHVAVPAHALDRLHARRRDLRRAYRCALGVPPAQDQRRRRQPEREREPAAPGI